MAYNFIRLLDIVFNLDFSFYLSSHDFSWLLLHPQRRCPSRYGHTCQAANVNIFTQKKTFFAVPPPVLCRARFPRSRLACGAPPPASWPQLPPLPARKKTISRKMLFKLFLSPHRLVLLGDFPLRPPPPLGRDALSPLRLDLTNGDLGNIIIFVCLFVCLLTGSCQAVATFSQVTGCKRLVQCFFS